MAVRPSLKGRAALAVALLIGFYLLALGIAAALLYVPYAEWVYAERVTGRILIFCVAGALAILRGIVPRRDQFDPPGPIVTESDQPRLFAVIKDVSATTEQSMPEEVYLLPEVNAFVAQRGGIMGFGSRRVMGIGLPLLESLTVQQFRAVIAHEFGHYHGGDTKLGPWVYQTRASIIRTLHSLSEHSGILQKPFIWYGEAFSRLTLAISRQQEYVADELAARTNGARYLRQALTELERSGNAFGAYMRQEFAGAVEAGFRPPLVEGFARFQAAPRVRSKLDELLAKEIEEGEAGRYDSHPSLKQRLAALSKLHDVDATNLPAVVDVRAITLIDDVPRAEAALVGSMLQSDTPAPIPIAWEDVPSRVLTLGWQQVVQPSLPGLDGLTPAIFPEIARRLNGDADALVRQLGVAREEDPDITRLRADAHLGAALCLVLDEHRRHSDEIRVAAPPGEPVVFHITTGDKETLIEPFSVVDSLRSGTLAETAWLEMCRAFGITDDDLGACCRRTIQARANAVSRALLG